MTSGVEYIVGFDSAWTDSPRAPGAITAIAISAGRLVDFHEPRLASFEEALLFIKALNKADNYTLVALDQPTIVANATSMRPVERVVASLISWLGGGVQPSNTNKTGMFCSSSPIWSFLKNLAATEDPETSRTATRGVHLVEVFPALALPSFDERFFGRLKAPRYNPERRKTFRLADWLGVAEVAALAFGGFEFDVPAAWCRQAGGIEAPRKADQDKLDAMLCLLVALQWRLRPRTASVMLGCLEHGYMVAPASRPVRDYLTTAATRRGLPVDGVIAQTMAA